MRSYKAIIVALLIASPLVALGVWRWTRAAGGPVQDLGVVMRY